MVEIKAIEADRLSTFGTHHRFLHYGEFASVEEFIQYHLWARDNGLPLYILANGSNTLFVRRRIQTLVLRNRLEPWMKDLGAGRIEASSSLPVMKILKHCEKEGLDSFYFMASVPALIGGAIAMNAGGGSGPTICDYLESVTYLDGDTILTVKGSALERGHRRTMFTGVQDRLILSAIFRFSTCDMRESEITKRIRWCHEHQDLSAPNCGSVFREYFPPLLRFLQKLRRLGLGSICWFFLKARFSRKVNNWIINRNKRSWGIVYLIRTVQILHRVLGKRAKLELIEVD